jgi:outer membrane murein-binding lipoprotein Lpp
MDNLNKLNQIAKKISEAEQRPAMYLSEISEHTKETNEHVKGISTNVEDINSHIAELYKKVDQLNADLDAERQRADKAVSRARWFTIGITLFSVLFSYWINHL